MLVNIKVTGGWNIESGQIDPKATQGLNHTFIEKIIKEKVVFNRIKTSVYKL